MTAGRALCVNQQLLGRKWAPVTAFFFGVNRITDIWQRWIRFPRSPSTYTYACSIILSCCFQLEKKLVEKKKKKTERKAKQRSSGSLEPCSELNSQCLIGANGMGVLRGWQTHSESQCTWFAYVSNVGRCLWLIRSEIDSAVLWSQQFLLPFVLYENDLLFCVRWMCVCVCEGEREIRCWDWNWILHGRHGRRKYSAVWGKKKKKYHCFSLGG